MFSEYSLLRQIPTTNGKLLEQKIFKDFPGNVKELQERVTRYKEGKTQRKQC
jgi:transcriptional regulator with AAA-type ATPase domain